MADTSAPAPGLRLASYNVRKAIGLDRKRDPERILQVIAELDADVVALQEADFRLGQRASVFDPAHIADVTGLRALPLGSGPESLGWHGNAVLVKPGVTLHEADRLDLPGLEPRGAVVVDLDTTAGGLTLVATHLGLLKRHRRQQAETLHAVLDDKLHRPAVIFGDLNEWRPTGGLSPFTKRFQIHAPGQSYHAARPVAALDRFVLSPMIALRSSGVHQSELARRASDHLPIWADIDLRTPQTG